LPEQLTFYVSALELSPFGNGQIKSKISGGDPEGSAGINSVQLIPTFGSCVCCTSLAAIFLLKSLCMAALK